MLGKKHLHKRIITSSNRRKMIKMETDIIMESYENIQSTSASTSSSENTSQSENVHDDHTVQTEFENTGFNDDIVQNEFENVLHDEDLNEYEFSDENIRVVQDINNVIENNNIDSASNRNTDFKTFLSQWAIKEHISQSSSRSLLKGIKEYTCKNCSFDIPLDPRTLMHTLPKMVD